MKNLFLSLMVLAIAAMACFVSCKHVEPIDSENQDVQAILQNADSLVDIAPDSALVLCHQFLRTAASFHDSLYARAKHIEGNAYFSMGDLEEAKKSMVESKKAALSANDLYTLINATADLGVFMRVSQSPDSALSLYNEAMKLTQKGNFPDEQAHLLTSIAILYANQGHLSEAADYADKALEAARISGDVDMKMYATSQAGAIYNLLGKRDKAFRLTHEAIAEARLRNLPRYELKALCHLIDLHLSRNAYDSVEHYLRRGEAICAGFPQNSVEGIGFLEEKYVVLAAMGRNRESLDVQKQMQALQAAPTFMPIDKLWLRMARNYDALHQTDSAAFCYERAFEISDSIRGEETDRRLNEFYARFKTSEKEIALANMEREKAKSDMWLAIWIGIASVLAALTIIGIFIIRNRKRKERINLLQSHIDGIEHERGRLAKDLHDGVCNDLYGIEMLLQANVNSDELLTEIEKIREDVRRISYEMMPPAIQDVGLGAAIEGLVDKLRHTHPAITFNYIGAQQTLLDNIPINVSYALYRICQELTGNIVRHSNPSEIGISLIPRGNMIRLEIYNNGKYDESMSETKSFGIGIESVRQRIVAIGGSANGLPFSSKIIIECKIR